MATSGRIIRFSSDGLSVDTVSADIPEGWATRLVALRYRKQPMLTERQHAIISPLNFPGLFGFIRTKFCTKIQFFWISTECNSSFQTLIFLILTWFWWGEVFWGCYLQIDTVGLYKVAWANEIFSGSFDFLLCPGARDGFWDWLLVQQHVFNRLDEMYISHHNRFQISWEILCTLFESLFSGGDWVGSICNGRLSGFVSYCM